MPNHLENARLISVLQTYARVRNEGSAEDLVKISNEFDQALDSADRPTRIWANARKQQIDDAVEEEAFRIFAEQVDQLSEFQDILNLGKKMAEEGEDELIFPSAAASLARIDAVLKEIKSAAASIKAKAEVLEGNISDVIEAVKVSDLTVLIDELEAVRSEADSIVDIFNEFKESIE
ncbi:MAG: hypothetical protein GWM87_06720 [Xanthomonadales bacterium]|nr:hypothetical protein [Xanthomonadales bacterium]NIX12658.1 hypothetical protein [Xanthomonadales bacterium]